MARKPAVQSDSNPVKMTVVIDGDTYVRLAALAAMNRCDRSAQVVQFIREGLKGQVAVIDKRKPRQLDLAGSVDRVNPSSNVESSDAA